MKPFLRAVLALVGLGMVAFLVSQVGIHSIAEALSRASGLFPLILALEISILACTMCGLRLLYAKDRRHIPLRALIRSGLISYAVMGLVPAGRAVAESTRAAMLARYSTPARAGVAAARMQGVALLANGAISVLATLVMLYVVGPYFATGAIATNAILSGALGMCILLVGQRSRVGTWLGRHFSFLRKFGREFDDGFAKKELVPVGAFGWEFAGRVIQVIQNAVLVVAVGGRLGLFPAFCSEATHLVGVAVGDLVPAQLGATELNFRASAHALGLHAVDALAIALLAHMAQLTWVCVGLIVSLVWRDEEPSAVHPTNPAGHAGAALI